MSRLIYSFEDFPLKFGLQTFSDSECFEELKISKIPLKTFLERYLNDLLGLFAAPERSAWSVVKHTK